MSGEGAQGPPGHPIQRGWRTLSCRHLGSFTSSSAFVHRKVAWKAASRTHRPWHSPPRPGPSHRFPGWGWPEPLHLGCHFPFKASVRSNAWNFPQQEARVGRRGLAAGPSGQRKKRRALPSCRQSLRGSEGIGQDAGRAELRSAHPAGRVCHQPAVGLRGPGGQAPLHVGLQTPGSPEPAGPEPGCTVRPELRTLGGRAGQRPSGGLPSHSLMWGQEDSRYSHSASCLSPPGQAAPPVLFPRPAPRP